MRLERTRERTLWSLSLLSFTLPLSPLSPDKDLQEVISADQIRLKLVNSLSLSVKHFIFFIKPSSLIFCSVNRSFQFTLFLRVRIRLFRSPAPGHSALGPSGHQHGLRSARFVTGPEGGL